MGEDDGQAGVLHVTEHQQRDEDQPSQDGGGDQRAPPGRLQRRPSGEPRQQDTLGSGLTHWRTVTAPRPTRSTALKTMKQQTQVKTLSAGGEAAIRAGGRRPPPLAAPAPTKTGETPAARDWQEVL